MTAAGRVGAQPRLSQFSIFNLPPRSRIMAVLKGYFDDSQDQQTNKIWTIAGYAGDDGQWIEYESRWPEALAKHGVPYFHRKEMSRPNGVYKKWYPAHEHEAELAAFQNDLAKVIGESRLRAFGSTVYLQDLNRFNAETGLNLDAYSMAAYGCMLVVGKAYPDEKVELIFDHVEKVNSKLLRAGVYAETDLYYGPRVFGHVLATGLHQQFTFKDVIAMQAADFWAWEWRKHQIRFDEWHEIESRPSGYDDTWARLQGWTRTKRPVMRKSAKALLENAPFVGIVWDYKNICDANEARGGVWA